MLGVVVCGAFLGGMDRTRRAGRSGLGSGAGQRAACGASPSGRLRVCDAFLQVLSFTLQFMIFKIMLFTESNPVTQGPHLRGQAPSRQVGIPGRAWRCAGRGRGVAGKRPSRCKFRAGVWDTWEAGRSLAEACGAAGAYARCPLVGASSEPRKVVEDYVLTLGMDELLSFLLGGVPRSGA